MGLHWAGGAGAHDGSAGGRALTAMPGVTRRLGLYSQPTPLPLASRPNGSGGNTRIGPDT